MSVPNFGSGPNLAPTGVIQNPGSGAILGQGLSVLAQFLQQKQQMEQQQALQQQRIGLEQSQQQMQAPLIQAQTQNLAAEVAVRQQQQQALAQQALQRTATVANMKQYLAPGPNGEPAPAEADMGPAQAKSYWNSYQLDPQGTADHLTKLMTDAPVKLAANERMISPLTGKTLVDTEAPPVDVGTDFRAHQQGLGYGNIPLPKLSVTQNREILDSMGKDKREAAQKTIVQIGQDAMASGIGQLRAKNLETQYGAATFAAQDVALASNALKKLSEGTINTGVFASAAQSLGATLASMGFDPDPKSVRTAQIVKDLASRTIPIVRQMIQGGGGRIMSSEIDLAKAQSGDIRNMSPQAIKNLLEDAVAAGTWRLGQYKAWLKAQNVDQFVPGSTNSLDVSPSNFMPPTVPEGTPEAANPEAKKAALKKEWGVGP